MKPTKILLSGLIVLFLTSCSYFTKKSCEETNWHQHGYNLAMQGKRVDGDSLVTKCEKVDALVRHDQLSTGFKEGMNKYCDIDTVYKKGRAGDDFNFSFCDGPGLRKMKSEFKRGIHDLCKTDGYKYGAKGKVYNNICPPKLEKTFMAQYKKGRRKHLRGQISQAEASIDALEDELDGLDREKAVLQGQLMAMPVTQTQQRVRVCNSSRTQCRTEIKMVEDPRNQSRRAKVKRKYDNLNHQIKRKRKQKSAQKKKIRALRSEIDELRG